MTTLTTDSLGASLHADGPCPELADELMLFGQFVGSWKVETTYYPLEGPSQSANGRWDFGWILEGRAIQDVYDIPGRVLGTTVRMYIPELGAWRVVWSGALGGQQAVFVARKRDDEIVLELQGDHEQEVNWIFSEIEPRSFRWRAVESADGVDWRLGQEMAVRRD